MCSADVLVIVHKELMQMKLNIQSHQIHFLTLLVLLEIKEHLKSIPKEGLKSVLHNSLQQMYMFTVLHKFVNHLH